MRSALMEAAQLESPAAAPPAGPSGALFTPFFRASDVATAAARPAPAEFAALLGRMREAVKTGAVPWAAYPTFQFYADACFWTMRRLEYSYTVEAFVAIEAQVQRPLRVLDVGCGVVPLCNWVSTRGHEVWALDPLEADIACVASQGVNDFYGSSVHYLAAAAEALPLPGGTFDVATSVSVLEHLPSGTDRLALMEIARVLKPGGRLILTFDVSPPSDSDRPARRAYQKPFSPSACRRLLEKIAPWFEVSPASVPPELNALRWEDVEAFWAGTRVADGRADEPHPYLALGTTLVRRTDAPQPSAADVLEAYQEGIHALVEAVDFYEHHASERLRVIEVLSHAAEERLAVIERLAAGSSAGLGVGSGYGSPAGFVAVLRRTGRVLFRR
jgi:ubiquinone/menaquinone biosynthesis C-methylase UbiE